MDNAQADPSFCDVVLALIIPILSIGSIGAARPRSSAGPELLGTMLDQRLLRVVPGVGGFMLQDLGPRSAVTGDSSGAFAYQRAIAGSARKPREWNCSVGLGWSADRARYVNDDTKIHAGGTRHIDEVVLGHYLVGRIGAEYRIFIGKSGTLVFRLTDDWRCPIAEGTAPDRSIRHHGLTVSMVYAWRW